MNPQEFLYFVGIVIGYLLFFLVFFKKSILILLK